MGEDSQERKVTVPTVFINGKAYPLNGEYQINEEDMNSILDEINKALAEKAMDTFKDIQENLPMLGQFFQKQNFIPKIEGKLKGNLRLTFNGRSLVNLDLPNFEYPDKGDKE
jgi:hypothetical protein